MGCIKAEAEVLPNELLATGTSACRFQQRPPIERQQFVGILDQAVRFRLESQQKGLARTFFNPGQYFSCSDQVLTGQLDLLRGQREALVTDRNRTDAAANAIGKQVGKYLCDSRRIGDPG